MRFKDLKCRLLEAKTLKYWCQPSKGYIDQTVIQSHTHTLDPNLPGGRAVLAAAGVDDWLVVIETAKGKFLPDGLSLIPLGLPEKKRKYMNIKNINKSAAAAALGSISA